MMPDVTIIGGGFAGLSAAVRLAQRGARVEVLEARPTLGGRASAFRDPKSGEWVDNGQHLMLGCYRETFAFLDAIGARDRVRLQPRLRVPMVDRDARATTLTCPALPSPFHLLGGLVRWEALGWTDRLSSFRMALALARGARPGESVDQWLARNGQSRRLRDMLWDPLAIAALNQEPAHAAAPYFARVVTEMLRSGAAGSCIATPAVALHEMYAEPARQWLEARGSKVTTGARAVVRLHEGVVAGISTPVGERTIGVVVVAVPWHALPTIFQGDTAPLDATLSAAAHTPASPIFTVNLWAKGEPLDEPLVGLPGGMVQWVFDKRVIFGRHATHLSLVSSAAAPLEGLTNEAIADRAIAEVRRALPALRSSEILRANVVRERRATFSLAPGAPPRPGARTAIPGLFLAGDWIDTGLPGTIESAVRSGHMAAEAAASPRA
jgi:squalene-associated FAD-dependent desaturase